MGKIAIYAVIIVVVISPLVLLVHLNSNSGPKTGNYSQLNSEVRSSMMQQTSASLTWAEYNGIHLNATDIVDHTMHRFYLLENLSSFKDNYLNYSKNFSVSMSFNFNVSQFNSTDPDGLSLDHAFFTFNDIAKVNQSEKGGIQEPILFESIGYSINLGNGYITGPFTNESIGAYN